MGCSLVEVELDLVAHLAECCLSSAVAVVFDQVLVENGTGGKTAKKKRIEMLQFVRTKLLQNILTCVLLPQ